MTFTKDQIKNMPIRHYVDKTTGTVKLIFGKDEWQMVVKANCGKDARLLIHFEKFKLSDIEPAVIDSNIIAIRKKLKKLSDKMLLIMKKASRINDGGINMYDADTRRKTTKISNEIMSIKQNGL